MIPTTSSIASGYTSTVDFGGMPYVASGTSIGNQKGPHFKRWMTTKKIFGRSDALDTTYEAIYTSLPSQQWYWFIRFNAADGITVQTGVYRVKLVYYIEFFERHEIPQS